MLDSLITDNSFNFNAIKTDISFKQEDSLSLKNNEENNFSSVMRETEREIKPDKKEAEKSVVSNKNESPENENISSDKKIEENVSDGKNVPEKKSKEVLDDKKNEYSNDSEYEKDNLKTDKKAAEKAASKKIKFDMIIDFSILENTKDKKELIDNIKGIIQKLNKTTDDLKKNKKDGDIDVQNILLMLSDLKSMLETISLKKDNKDIKADGVKEKLSELIKKAENMPLDAETKNAVADIKENINSMLSKDDSTPDISLNENVCDKTNLNEKGKKEFSSENTALNENVKTEESYTEFTVSKAKDLGMSSDIKTDGAKDLSKPPASQTSSTAETMTKFQDILSKIAEKARLTISEGKSEMIIALKPEHLGNVRMKMTMEGDNLYGKVFVDNAEIKDIFTKNLDTIISALKELNVNIEGFDVALRHGNQSDNGESLFENEHGTKDGRKSDGVSENYIEDTIMLANQRFSDKRINIVI